MLKGGKYSMKLNSVIFPKTSFAFNGFVLDSSSTIYFSYGVVVGSSYVHQGKWNEFKFHFDTKFIQDQINQVKTTTCE